MFEFFDYLYEWFTSGLYDFAMQFVAWALKKMLIFYYEAAVASIEFAWGTVQIVLDDLNISSFLLDSISDMPVTVQQVIVFFRIPEFINLILSALGTRLVLRIVPFV